MNAELYNLRIDRIAIATFIGFYVLFGIGATIFQERLMYMPSAQVFEDCPAFRNASSTAYNDTRFYFKPVTDKVVVFYHGNAGSACDRAFVAELFAEAGYSSLFPEYEGYAHDGKIPSHAGVRRTVAETVGYIKMHHFSRVVVAGESIGAGAAAYHASLSAPSRMVLFAPFTSLIDIARAHYWYYPVRLMVKDAFPISSLLSSYHNAFLVVHGENDHVIPFELGKGAFAGVPAAQKQLVSVPNAGHDDLFAYPMVHETLKRFLQAE